MKYTKLEMVGDNSVEHTIEGDFEEVLALLTELEEKDAVEYYGDNLVGVNWESPNVTNLVQETYK